MKKAIKTYRRSVQNGESKEVIQNNLIVVYRTIDKAARKNIIHTKNAARKKSRLSKLAVA